MVKDVTNKHYTIAYITIILKVTLNFLYTLAQLMKLFFYANLLSILSPPYHMHYHMQSFFVVKKITTIRGGQRIGAEELHHLKYLGSGCKYCQQL